MLGRHGIIASMSGKGNCYDNAMVETVFKTIKSELIWRTSFQSRRQAKKAIARYIDGFYNPSAGIRKISKLDAAATQLANDAARGDKKSIQLVFALLQALEPAIEAQRPVYFLGGVLTQGDRTI
jgi:integrase-like protein